MENRLDLWLLLLGSLLTLAYTVSVCIYAAHHYTRIWGGRWGRWEEIVTSGLSGVSKEEAVA